MKILQYTLFALFVLLATSCEPLSDIKDELDDSYYGPVNKELSYVLTGSDYKSISESAVQDATTAKELKIAKSVLEGDTALTADLANKYVPEMLDNMAEMYGYARGSLNAVTFKFREAVDEASSDSTSRYFKFSNYAWMVFPEPGYLETFDGTKDEDVLLNGWTQYNTGASTDKLWVYRMVNSSMCASGSAYKGEGDNYNIWLVSPGLDVDNVFVTPNLKFETAYGYDTGSSFKVYLMDKANPDEATEKVDITEDITLVSTKDDNYNKFISSGEIDLSAYKGLVYVGFEYIAGKGQTTNFYLDNFTFDYIEVE